MSASFSPGEHQLVGTSTLPSDLNPLAKGNQPDYTRLEPGEGGIPATAERAGDEALRTDLRVDKSKTSTSTLAELELNLKTVKADVQKANDLLKDTIDMVNLRSISHLMEVLQLRVHQGGWWLYSLGLQHGISGDTSIYISTSLAIHG
jgi:hypothetical protein